MVISYIGLKAVDINELWDGGFVAIMGEILCSGKAQESDCLILLPWEVSICVSAEPG